MNDLVRKLITPTQAARYMTAEEGTPEYETAQGFLKWAGKDGTTHVFSDRGEPGAWEKYLERLECAS
jgi:hypothetical protein